MNNITQRAAQYVAAMPPSISGKKGHQATFSVAVALRWGFNLTEEEALPLLKDYNKRCKPPWSEKELRHKLASADALTHHSQPRGYLRENAKSTHTLPAKPAKPAKPIRLRVVSWQERVAEVVNKAEAAPVSKPSSPAIISDRAPYQRRNGPPAPPDVLEDSLTQPALHQPSQSQPPAMPANDVLLQTQPASLEQSQMPEPPRVRLFNSTDTEDQMEPNDVLIAFARKYMGFAG